MHNSNGQTLFASLTLSSLTFAQSAPAQPTTTAVGKQSTFVEISTEMIGNQQVNMARLATLKAMQANTPDRLSENTLGKIYANLAKVPSKT